MADQAALIVSDDTDAVEVWNGLTAAQRAALVVLADGKSHYCWKWASGEKVKGGIVGVNAMATSRLRTLHLARTVSYGGAFTGDTVEITEAGQAVFDSSVFA